MEVIVQDEQFSIRHNVRMVYHLFDLIEDIGAMHPGYWRPGGAGDTPGTVEIVELFAAEDVLEDLGVVLQHASHPTLYQFQGVHC